MKSLISLLSVALLTWELYGPVMPKIDFFELDASLPIVSFAPSPTPDAATSTAPMRYIDKTPSEILAIATPQPVIRKENVEPGMSDETEQGDVTGQHEEPSEVTLMPGNGTGFLSSGSVVIHNETKINVNMSKVMSRKVSVQLAAKKPQILIVHTHGTEGYWDGGTVVDIGDRLTELLIAQGFNVIHDRTAYDEANYKNSYSSALAGITKTLKANPSIQVVLDIHRDSIQTSDGVVKKPVTVINGKKAAQLMFVVGTNNSGMPHDNWPHNLAFAVAMQKRLAEEIPELMRPINLRRERFNQHTTKGSLILEVGAYGNNYDEVLYAIELYAEQTGEVLKGLVK